MTSRERIPPNLRYHDLSPPPEDMAAEVFRSLSADQPRLHPKYFYDRRGSELFEAITRLPEYYPTRTECALLTRHRGEIATLCGDGMPLAEPGAGNCEKVRLLLADWQPAGYMPLEISGQQLLEAARELALEHPQLDVTAVCADYTRPMALPDDSCTPPRLVFFPGSTIGNFEPEERLAFLCRLRELAGEGGALLIGADLHKDPAVLNAAYNDAAGITAAFNRNLLAHLNRELDAGFEPEAFQHRAFYDEARQRIEMHLECLRDQRINVDGHIITLPAGARIHTENSYKFTVAGFRDLLLQGGFEPVRCWRDPDDLFSVHLARAA